MADPEPTKQPISRTVVYGVVGLAVFLSVVGLVLAIQQSQAVVMGRIADLRPEACRRIASLDDHVAERLDASLRAVAEEFDPDRVPTAGNEAERPTWLGTTFVWDGTDLRTDRPGGGENTDPAEAKLFHRLVRSRLALAMSSAGPGAEADSLGYFHDRIAGRPTLVAYRPYRRSNGQALVAAASLNLDRLRAEVVEPQLTAGGDLTLIEWSDASEATRQGPDTAWAESLAPLFPWWAVAPSPEFVARQQTAGTRQSFLYMAVTVLALAVLLLAIRALNRAVRHEIVLSQMKSQFVADVSHELKTPLALIRMFGETLLDNRVKSPEKAKEYHEIITRESTRLTHLINNILDFSRIEAGRKDYRKDPVDVGRVVRETYELYRHELDHAGFEHRCVIGDNLPEVLGDADALGQVVLNLISNAIKYSAEEKHLVVEVGPETRRGKHGVLILVQDRGIGIQPEDRARLFDGFFRATDVQVRKRRGTGLGLALCKHIVEAHQGYIDVESRLVRGSTFRIFLPQQPTPTPAEESR
jgi:signal transduction histidine kinase